MYKYSMCCLHYKAYTRPLIFAAQDMFALCLFWSKMALLAFWVADSCFRPMMKKSKGYSLEGQIDNTLKNPCPRKSPSPKSEILWIYLCRKAQGLNAGAASKLDIEHVLSFSHEINSLETWSPCCGFCYH